MRFPISGPHNTPQEEPVNEVEKGGFAHIPEEARRKILRVLQGDMLKRNKSMDEELKAKTLGTIIDFEETDAEQHFGKLVDPEHTHSYPTPQISDLEKPTIKPKSQAVQDHYWQDTIAPEYLEEERENNEEETV